ncbi:glycerophosphodiester phosphodiesterase [Clostridium sp. E02]|uniref:glycerophosphodiester phosphodiesterase n=1 Tax=Clostridium sp. E02 TaxID=2487134 RepID=UPI000F536414|nr:glycerophosphodiester phosphodiesterase [Clostridium sp. E02]
MTTKVWAHRGASAYAPENTLEAFELAIKQKADGIELDVQLTKDGKMAVIHDETIDRTCDGVGFVTNFTMKELKNFHCNRTHPEYPSAVIPELKEVLDLLKPTGLTVNIELKTGVFRYKGLEEKAMRLVESMGFKDRIIYSSFHHPSIIKIKKLNPNALTGMLYSDGWINVLGYAKLIGADALHPSFHLMRSEKLILEARKRNLPLHVWTVNEKPIMESLVREKIGAIITNYPDIARRIIDRKETGT